MKILYVSQYFPPEMGAPAARVSELSRLWTDAGHEVTVLTAFPNHPTGVVPGEYRRKMLRLVYKEKLSGVRVMRSWIVPLPNRKSFERILNYGSFCVSAASTGMFLPRPDVVIATSPQPLVGLAGWWIAKLKRVPFILEVRDLWPESLSAVGAAAERSLLYRALRRMVGFLYRACDRLVVVTSDFKQHIVENYRIPDQKISIVQNGVDTNLFNPRSENSGLRSALGLEDKFVVSYIGTMGMAHSLETVIEAASMSQNSAPRIVFLLVGEGAEKQRLVSCARQRGLTNLRFVDQQPRELIPAYICASDACIVSLRRSELFHTVLPTKMLEFMSCARPVIVSVDGLARKIVSDANSGIFVEPENPTALADAVLKLAANPALCEALGRKGRRYILQNFTRGQKAEAYLRVLEDLLEAPESCAVAAA
jgi:colanic acid biosynthesis glycosyl transferase WcaI